VYVTAPTQRQHRTRRGNTILDSRRADAAGIVPTCSSGASLAVEAQVAAPGYDGCLKDRPRLFTTIREPAALDGTESAEAGDGIESIYTIENMMFTLFAIDLCLKDLLPWTR
jgi:hypothetical protein